MTLSCSQTGSVSSIYLRGYRLSLNERQNIVCCIAHTYPSPSSKSYVSEIYTGRNQSSALGYVHRARELALPLTLTYMAAKEELLYLIKMIHKGKKSYFSAVLSNVWPSSLDGNSGTILACLFLFLLAFFHLCNKYIGVRSI